MLTELGQGWDLDQVQKHPTNLSVSSKLYKYIKSDESNMMSYIRNTDGSEMSAIEKSALIHEKITRHFNNLRRLEIKRKNGNEPPVTTVVAATKNRRRARKHYVSTSNSEYLSASHLFCLTETGT